MPTNALRPELGDNPGMWELTRHHGACEIISDFGHIMKGFLWYRVRVWCALQAVNLMLKYRPEELADLPPATVNAVIAAMRYTREEVTRREFCTACQGVPQESASDPMRFHASNAIRYLSTPTRGSGIHSAFVAITYVREGSRSYHPKWYSWYDVVAEWMTICTNRLAIKDATEASIVWA